MKYSLAAKRHKNYKKYISAALKDPFLKNTLTRFADDYLVSRRNAITPEYFERLKTKISEIKSGAIKNLNALTDEFTANAQKSGAVVFHAASSQDAVNYILQIAEKKKAGLIVKSKSMASEEIHLNHSLEKAGIEVCETDLGEWIIQLAGQKPSHMVMPAIHMTRQEVAGLFSRVTGKKESDEIPHLVKIARQNLRQKFLSADIGITGANIGIAGHGAVIIISNEGNARLSFTMPKTHIVIMGREKIVPSFGDAAAILDILPKNATGQMLTSYVSVLKGTDGACGREFHIILLDNGRSMLARDTDFSEALKCIRCGACANVCPVYRVIGGHLFGHIYVGGIGIVLTAFIHGMENAAEPAKACIGCRLCTEVCPAGIDIESLIAKLKKKIYVQEGTPLFQDIAFKVLSKPKLFHALLRAIATGQQAISRDRTYIEKLPKILPAIAVKPLRDMWADGKKTSGYVHRAAFFSGCLIDFVYPGIGKAVQKVLNASGIGLDFPKAQACCGYPAWHSGDMKTARKLAELHISIFSNPEYKYIITACPTCALSFRKNFRELAGSPALRKKADEIANKTYDFSEFVVKKLKIRGDAKSGDSAITGKATFHDSCHMKRSLGIYDEPREVLKNLGGYEIIEMKYPDRCCGLGGSYCLKYPEISDEIMGKKIDDIIATGAETVVSACPGCIMHIKGGLQKRGSRVKVKHVAETII